MTNRGIAKGKFTPWVRAELARTPQSAVGDDPKSLGSAGCIVRCLDARGTAWTLSYALSVLGLGRPASPGLGIRHPVLILRGNRSVAGISVDSSSRAVAANGLATRIFHAIGFRR
jgi:hypothetical protein